MARKTKLLNFDQLKEIRTQHPRAKIVHCHGVFDVLHAGHLSYFESAKHYGDLLVVTLTADEFVNKGPGRPYFSSQVRANMISALEVVDYVAVSIYPTAVPSIELIQPDFYVKGPDYKDKSSDITGAILAEEKATQIHGGQLVFTDDPVYSSSTLINSFFSHRTDEQQRTIDAIKKAGGLPVIEEILSQIYEEKVTVIGEPIVDTYVFCTPESISSKSPSISAKYLYEENYAGGSLAIANHLADFVKDISLILTHGGEKYFSDLLKEKMDPRIQLFAHELNKTPTPRKTRYIAAGPAQRIFEITDLRSDQWTQHSPKEICDVIEKGNKKSTITILADFGHGFFENSMLKTVSALDGFVGLNVQTNSSNFGFNPFTKHKIFSYLSIDTREVRVAYHDRFTSPMDLARKLNKEIKAMNASCSMTLGASGAYYFPSSHKEEYFSPALTHSTVDTTGAGDAYFAITSLLVKVGCPSVMIPFLGNVFAGLKTKIMGNKASVSRSQFLKAVVSILK